MNKGLIFISLFALSAAVTVVHSKERGNQTEGRKLAQDVCAECHSIDPGIKSSPNLLAPPFQDIADTPGMNGLALSVWSITPHKIMPNFAFSHEQRADIIAYILSLKSE